jgi:probable blue pigment (indigoidine) exporter
MSVHTSPRRASTSRVAVAALVAAAACWGVGTVVTKQVVDDIAPLTLLPMQLAASCAFLLTFEVVRHEPLSWSPSVRRLGALGALNPGLAYALGLIGLTTITASMSVLLWALEPVVILVLAAFVLREHISAVLAASIAVAIAGVLLVVCQPGASGAAVGITLTLVSIGCCALYTVLTRRLMLDDSSLNVVVAQQIIALVFAGLLATAVTVVGGTGWDAVGLDSGVWLGAAASGVLYYGLAFWLYLTGLQHVTASYAGAFLPLIPVFGVTTGYVVGERLEPRQWLGAAVIVAATAAITSQQRGPRNPRSRHDVQPRCRQRPVITPMPPGPSAMGRAPTSPSGADGRGSSVNPPVMEAHQAEVGLAERPLMAPDGETPNCR